jgi:hypothetical protein
VRVGDKVKNSLSDNDLRLEFYDYPVPVQVSGRIEDLYQSPYCLMDYNLIYHPSDKIDALVVLSHESPIQILLFTVKDKHVEVLNRLFSIDGRIVDFVSESIFKRYEKVVRVDFAGVYGARSSDIQAPHFLLKESADVVLELPGTPELYWSSLGKNIKGNIRRYSKRLRNDYRNVTFETKTGSGIEPATIRQIIGFNRVRMAKKGYESGIREDDEEKICKFSELYGQVGVIAVDGIVRAGVISYRVGQRVYADVVSHDSAYNQYDLGILSLYDTIRSCIETGAQEFHLLWGRSKFKYRLLGFDRQVHGIVIFRSNLNKVLSYNMVVADVARATRAKVESLMRDKLSASEKLRPLLPGIRKLYSRLTLR